ncbi:MAG: hypothetical protein AABZ12_12895 [Planctomycetota bacterium]
MTQTKELPWQNRHRNTTILVDALKTGKAHDRFLDEQLQGMIEHGVAPGQRGYGYLASAIRICEREHGVVWRRVPHGGYVQCCGAQDRLAIASCTAKTIVKRAKRVRCVLASAAVEGSAELKKQLICRMAQIGAIVTMASETTIKKLDARVGGNIDPKRLLASFVADAKDQESA